MSREIPIPLGERSHRAVLGGLDRWGVEIDLPELQERGRRGVLVTDSHVGPLWSDRVAGRLEDLGLHLVQVTVPAGEESKEGSHLEGLYHSFQSAGLRRDGWVVALGGGVVGDLAGFAAATWLRGVALLQIPTSLLSMCDSSIGGKVGINFGGGKNLIGSFHQPRLILTAPEFLGTLPDPELSNGLAEVIKTALIGDPLLFAMLERETEATWARDPAVLEELIARSAVVKARIVADDEREGGTRMLLNLGHTVGHAIEAAKGFRGIRHGEAVALGIVVSCELSRILGRGAPGLGGRVASLLTSHHLPTTLRGVSWEELEPWLSQDKKGREEGLSFVLTEAIGDVRVLRQVPSATLRRAASVILASSEA